MKYSKKETDEELEYLRSILKPGSDVYTTVRSVAKSGMSRTMTLHVVLDGEIRGITYSAAVVLGYPLQNGGSLRVNGCGMDMGFHIVYCLSRRLFPDGFIPAEAGKSGRNRALATELDEDGGYALTQRWL